MNILFLEVCVRISGVDEIRDPTPVKSVSDSVTVEKHFSRWRTIAYGYFWEWMIYEARNAIFDEKFMQFGNELWPYRIFKSYST